MLARKNLHPQHLPLFMRDVSLFLYLMIYLTSPPHPSTTHPHHHLHIHISSLMPHIHMQRLPSCCNFKYIHIYSLSNHFFIIHPCPNIAATLLWYMRTCIELSCSSEYPKMESLLCNEVWPMSPNVVQESNGATDDVAQDDYWEEAFGNFRDKEGRYMPEPGYMNIFLTNDLMRDSRFKAVNWLVKSQKRLNLSLGTVFIAVNYLDRFVSLSQCKGWKDWMFELLSIACLSVASKFNETTIFPLCEFQGDGLNHSFAPSLIQRMELTLLKGLGWRMASTTPVSYIQFLIQSNIDACNKTLVEDLGIRVTELLITALLDPKFLEFQPYVVAMSAVGCVFEDLVLAKRNASVFPDTAISQDQKDDLSKCKRSMRELQVNNILLACGNSWNGPSSPVTVLLTEECFNFCDDGCLLMNIDMKAIRKRKREEEEEEEECGL